MRVDRILQQKQRFAGVPETKDFDEDKHPRDAHGRFGSGSAEPDSFTSTFTPSAGERARTPGSDRPVNSPSKEATWLSGQSRGTVANVRDQLDGSVRGGKIVIGDKQPVEGHYDTVTLLTNAHTESMLGDQKIRNDGDVTGAMQNYQTAAHLTGRAAEAAPPEHAARLKEAAVGFSEAVRQARIAEGYKL